MKILVIGGTGHVGLRSRLDSAPYEDHRLKIALVIALTAVVMGLRNAVVRKLGDPT